MAQGIITTAAHGFRSGETVKYLNGGGADVGGLDHGAVYYVKRETALKFKLAATFADHQAKTYLPLTGGGSPQARFTWVGVNRADLTVPRLIVNGAAPGQGTTYGDVMIAHPHAATYTRAGRTKPDHVVCQAEAQNFDTYHTTPGAVRAGVTLVPLILSSLGRIGPSFLKFLRSAAAEVVRIKGPGVTHLDDHAPRGGDARFPAGPLLSRWMLLLSCTLQRNNARAWLSAHGPTTDSGTPGVCPAKRVPRAAGRA